MSECSPNPTPDQTFDKITAAHNLASAAAIAWGNLSPVEAQPAVDDALRTFMGAVSPEEFTALGHEEVRLSRTLDLARQTVGAITENFPFTTTELKEGLSSLSPTVEGIGDDIIGEYSEARTAALGNAEAALAQAEVDYTTFTNRFEEAGTALPRPYTPDSVSADKPRTLTENDVVVLRKALKTAEPETAPLFQPETPVETVTAENNTEKKELKKSLSENIADIFLNSNGAIISAKEIALKLHGKDTKAAVNRTTTLIRSNILGRSSALREAFSASDRTLCRSLNIVRNGNGKPFQHGYSYATIGSETSGIDSLPTQTVDGDRVTNYNWSVVEFEEPKAKPTKRSA